MQTAFAVVGTPPAVPSLSLPRGRAVPRARHVGPVAPCAVLDKPRVRQTEGQLPNVDTPAPEAARAYPPSPQTLTTPAPVVSNDMSKPGREDDLRFKQHWSVAFWRGRNMQAPDTLPETMRQIVDGIGGAGVFSSASAATYWTYHVGRSSFFLLQGATGILATRTASVLGGGDSNEVASRLTNMLMSGLYGPVSEAMAMYYQDYRNIQEGKYNLPWDMTTPRHRQFNPLYIARKFVDFVQEAGASLQRRTQGRPEDVWLRSDMYPDYYLNTFHYQTDGWLSSKSARVYEASTETLFLGRQDAMQRQTLVPLQEYMRARAPRGAGTKALELACGTGRFATFLKDNWPEMEVTAQDLSPYYLAEARANASHWRGLRQPGSNLGGYDGTGFTFVQAAAEAIPAPDNSYDVVTCIYLFHELPTDVRRKVVAEMARVVKPGGLVVLTDSVQLGDRPSIDANLGRFSDFNEPYYLDYISTDIGKLFMDVGMNPGQKLLASSTKVLSFTKPL